MSLYEYCDPAGTPVPAGRSAESLCFNGHWLEDEIPGFRVLSVSGRELLGSEITETPCIGGAYGSTFEDSHKLTRDIKVTYMLVAGSHQAFRGAFNSLNAILKHPQKQIIFADEPDKYFIGTLTDAGEVPAGTDAVVAEFTLHCADPVKYSVSQSAFKAAVDDEGQLSMTICNGGTEPAPIDYTISHAGENGYIGISDGEHSMEFGDRIEPDEEERALSEYAVRNWESFGSPSYTDNSYTVQSDVNTNGTWQVSGANLLYPYSYGDFGSGKKWRGVSRSYNLTKPAALPDMKNWLADFCFYISYSKNTQRGLQWFGVLNADNAMICGIKIIKDQKNSMWATVDFWVRGLGYCKSISTTSVGGDISADGRHVSITKRGDTFTFRYGGKDYSFVAPDLIDAEAGRLYFSAYAMDPAENQMNFRVQGIWFRVDSSYIYDLPNRFSEGSVCTIDGRAQTFSVDGSYRPADEIMGSTYFMAEPGVTRVTFGFSDFCETAPEVTARIRESWL